MSIKCDVVTSHISGLAIAGIILLWYWIYIHTKSSAERCRQDLKQIWPLKPWIWPLSHEGGRKIFCFIATKTAIRLTEISEAFIALLKDIKHKSSWQLLGQCANGRLFRRLKSEWLPRLGYRELSEAVPDVSYYMMDYYNCNGHINLMIDVRRAKAESDYSNVRN